MTLYSKLAGIGAVFFLGATSLAGPWGCSTSVDQNTPNAQSNRKLEEFVFSDEELPGGFKMVHNAPGNNRVFPTSFGKRLQVSLDPGPAGIELVEINGPTQENALPAPFRETTPGWQVLRRFYRNGNVFFVVWAAESKPGARERLDKLSDWLAQRIGSSAEEIEPPLKWQQ